ncbi:hypothetical protein A0J61_11929, partial [Choanephora cucurbitarum]
VISVHTVSVAMESQSSSSQPPVALNKEVRDKLFLA